MPFHRFLAALLLACLLSAAASAQTLIKRNVAYGSDEEQRLDIYAPEQARNAPVILLVHGGAWRNGDKDSRYLLENKLARWLPRGFVVVAVNYRLLPKARPLEQAQDVARAMAMAQSLAPSYGGDRNKFILMGHSAGGHLVALLAAKPALATAEGARPWLGSVVLDSGALNVPAIMTSRHLPLYERAFGSDPTYWTSVSPYHQLSGRTAPILFICSRLRLEACPQAREFVSRAESFGTRSAALGQDLSHAEINHLLGIESPYTTAVEAFMRGLDIGIGEALK